MRDFYRNFYCPDDTEEKTPAEPENTAPPTYDKVDEELFKAPVRSVYKRYGNAEPDISDDPAESESPKEGSPDPYIITYAEWANRTNSYDQVSVVYYEGDDILIEDDGRPHPDDEIDELGGFKLDIEDTVGRSNLENPDDDDVIYIRNDRYGIDYEVNFDPRAYYKDVLGEFGVQMS